MRKIVQIMTSKIVIVGTLIFLQIFMLAFFVFTLTQYFAYLYGLFVIISVFITIWIINRPDNPSYKFAWCIPILLFPLFGGLFYLMFGNKKIPRKTQNKAKKVAEDTLSLFHKEENIIEELRKQPDIYKQAYYLQKNSFFPMYKNCANEYFPSGEIMFERMKEELRKAKKFIFLEYFIVEEGIFWNAILDILVQKVKEGVEVRMIYDDAGCISTLPSNYYKRLEKLGIKTFAFNPIVPRLLIQMNNRDHRKILVIDGNVAFTGGINLADEYINAYERFGHWKDTGICIQGEAVWNFTLMFLQFWNVRFEAEEEYLHYRPDQDFVFAMKNEGYILPYADAPTDEEIVGENVHINMLNMAKNYVYIETPYLICDNEVITALTLAAKNGIDVRMILPHIADKWYVHTVTRAYYRPLIEAGVKVFEYTPGFIHAKAFISDDETAVIGTVNMDYRSYYLHHECGVWMHKTESVMKMKEDFLHTQSECQLMDLTFFDKEKWITKIMRAVLRVFAPLM